MPNQIPAVIRPYLPFMKSVLLALVILIVGWIAAKFAARLVLRGLQRMNIDTALSRFLANLARYGVLAAVVISSLSAVGVETTSLVAVFASAGLAIGLALQGSLGHFASGVMILLFRPFNLGDFVTVGGQMGTVNDIGLFATTLVTPSNEKIIVPNSKITNDSIINNTTLGTRRGTVSVGVAYGSDIAKVKALLLEAVQKLEIVLTDPAPNAVFVGLGASSLDFDVMVWGKSTDYLAMLHQTRTACYDALNAANIEIPFNQIVVHKAS